MKIPTLFLSSFLSAKILMLQKGDFPRLPEPCLGQKPLWMTPEVFASYINTKTTHSVAVFSPDGRIVFYVPWSTLKMDTMMQIDSVWTKPRIISFTSDYDAENPWLTLDGSHMYFTSTRPLNSKGLQEKKKFWNENFWYVERTSTDWSEPKPVSSEVNSMQLHWAVSISNSGTLYFGGTGQDGYGSADIYYSRLVDGEYKKPVNIGPSINSKAENHCPYIAPDESYIIFSRMDNTGVGFYIRFKGKDGRWLNPVKLHDELERVCPLLSPDGKYFFFNSDGIYWMLAKFIEELRPKE